MIEDDGRRLLEDIRDIQRAHLAEFQRVTHQSLELQRQAVKRQEQLGALYRQVLVVGGAAAVVLLALLIFLLVRWAPRLFG